MCRLVTLLWCKTCCFYCYLFSPRLDDAAGLATVAQKTHQPSTLKSNKWFTLERKFAVIVVQSEGARFIKGLKFSLNTEQSD